MSDIAILVENISKQYRLGQVGRKSLSQDINRWWHTVRGKEDPYLKIGQENDRTTKGSSEYVWALKDINFDVTRGEVLGIIGRNGAGKSTMLKILSKVTAPTTGTIKTKGRIASLLEVGTGFHPDLSGRDNIYLNGAILGMTKKEITSKFDEMVDFAGVERYIDTPVKRYSSGMYVRLAFAVAAHLEPEILIVDEVLAVGDAEFQKKCLGKMKDVSEKDGRTILFVSHNMDAVLNLTNRCVVLANGKVAHIGNTAGAIEKYLNQSGGSAKYIITNPKKGVYFSEIEVPELGFIYNEPIIFELSIQSDQHLKNIVLGLGIYNLFNESIANTIIENAFNLVPGTNKFTISIPNHNLVPGDYKGAFAIAKEKTYEFFDTVLGEPSFRLFNDKEDTMLLSRWNNKLGYHTLPAVNIEAR
jgi:lipopolysaccharide transport system ATP-binding protein